jgi:phthalate 4,5-dioxygenase
MHRNGHLKREEDGMTTAIDSVELTRVGPDTVMGQLIREYWIPALMSSELARGGAPLRLMLLG